MPYGRAASRMHTKFSTAADAGVRYLLNLVCIGSPTDRTGELINYSVFSGSRADGPLDGALDGRDRRLHTTSVGFVVGLSPRALILLLTFLRRGLLLRRMLIRRAMTYLRWPLRASSRPFMVP